MKTAGAILRLIPGRGSLPVFLSLLIILLIQGEEREISGRIGVQFVYFNIDYSTKYFIGILDSRGRIFSKLKYSALGVNISKTFPFFAENDSEVTGMAVLCQKAVLV